MVQFNRMYCFSYMKKIFLLCAIFVGFSFGAGVTHAESAESIKVFDTVVEIKKDSTLRVTEHILYDFGSNIRHGIYRDIPLVGQDDELSLTSISVVDDGGTAYPFTVSESGGLKKIKIGDANQTITGEHSYDISYDVLGALGYFNSYDEVYWNATGDTWQVPIEQASVKVVLLDGSNVLQSSCYLGTAGSKESCDSSKKIDGKMVSFTANRELNPGEGVTVAVGFPKGAVTARVVTAPTEEELFNSKIYSFLVKDGWVFYGLLLIAFIYQFRKWYRYGKDPKGTGVIIPQYESPNGLSPMQVCFMLKQSFGNSLSAEIVYLATKGFITITRIPKQGLFSAPEDYELRKIKESDSSLNAFQTKLLTGLFNPLSSNVRLRELAVTEDMLKKATTAGGAMGVAGAVLGGLFGDQIGKQKEKMERQLDGTVTLAELRNVFYNTASEMYVDVEESLVTGGYIERQQKILSTSSGGGSRTLGIIIASLFFAVFGSIFGGVWASFLLHNQGVINFVCAYITFIVISAIFAILAPKMTPKGVAAKRWVEGFKLYLSVAEKRRIEFHNAPKKDPKIFEELLPYAMALGIEKEWAEAFEGITMAPPSWYGDSSMAGSFHSTAFAGEMSSFSSIGGSALTSSPHSGSGGGGSSGGGGGGGGGGSW